MTYMTAEKSKLKCSRMYMKIWALRNVYIDFFAILKKYGKRKMKVENSLILSLFLDHYLREDEKGK